MNKQESKLCPVCNEKVYGRRDKVYCSLKCKSTAQYEDRLENEQFYLLVEKRLRTNRKVLKKYNQAGKATIRKDELLQEGFNPKFFTHYWKNRQGDVYLFCYEFGFLERKENDKQKYVLILWQEYME